MLCSREEWFNLTKCLITYRKLNMMFGRWRQREISITKVYVNLLMESCSFWDFVMKIITTRLMNILRGCKKQETKIKLIGDKIYQPKWATPQNYLIWKFSGNHTKKIVLQNISEGKREDIFLAAQIMSNKKFICN